MAFVVEDGTGLEDANAYVDVAYVTDYLTDRNRVAPWAAKTEAEQKAAIIAATDYVEKRWSRNFVGQLAYTSQALSWPRVYSYNGANTTGVPRILKQAIAEYAERALGNPLWLDPPALTTDDTGEYTGAIKRKREKLGPLEEEIEFSEAGYEAHLSNLQFPSYPAADNLIYQLIRNNNTLVR